MRNGTRWVVTVGVVLAVGAPAVLPGADDGFPISTYPMFTSDRGRVMSLDTVVLVTGDGRERLSPEAIGGTDEIVLAAVIVGDAVDEGPAALQRLCREVAERVDRPGTVEIVTERHDTVALLQDGAAPVEIEVHDRCEASP